MGEGVLVAEAIEISVGRMSGAGLLVGKSTGEAVGTMIAVGIIMEERELVGEAACITSGFAIFTNA
jgi:hypothetical protein